MKNKLEFATTFVESTSYCGESAEEFVLACILKNRLADSGVKIVPDIIKSAAVSKLSGKDMVQCGDHCTFSPSGTVTVSEVLLVPCLYYIDLQLCFQELVGIWNGLNGGNLNTQDLSVDFNRALVDLLVGTMGEHVESVIWKGSTGVTSPSGCTCSVTSIEDQITTHALHSTGVTITKANVIGYVDELMAALPACVLEDPSKLKIYMNSKTALYYRQALAALGIILPSDSAPMTYDGLEIVVIGAIPDNKIFAFQPENVALGISSMDNMTTVNILNMREHNLDNSVRMSIAVKFDVKVIYEAEAAVLG